MIHELAKLVDNFPGSANQTRCFLHILNLVVKSIIQQFDIPTSKKLETSNGDEDDESHGVDEGMKELLNLAVNIDLEENIIASAGDEEDAMEDDNIKGWVDEHEGMTEEELLDFSESMQPVR